MKTDADATHAGFSIACNKCGGGVVRMEGAAEHEADYLFPIARLICVGCQAQSEAHGQREDLTVYSEGDF